VYTVQAVSPQVTLSHPPGGRLPLLSARPAVTSVVFCKMVAHTTGLPLVTFFPYASPLIYRLQKDERLSWPGWLPVADGLPTIVVTHRLQVEHRTGKTHFLQLSCTTARVVQFDTLYLHNFAEYA